MSPLAYKVTRIDVSFPRVSGDEPVYASDQIGGTLFSPRERG